MKVFIFQAFILLSLLPTQAEPVTQGPAGSVWDEAFPDNWRDVIDKSTITSGGIAAGSYKTFKFTNTVTEEDVAKILKEHGINERQTARSIGGITKAIKSRIVKYGSAALTITAAGFTIYSIYRDKRRDPGYTPYMPPSATTKLKP